MPSVHRTAIISDDAVLADDVTVGPYVVIEGPVTLGPGCIVRPFAHIVGRVTMGRGNDIGSGCVVGDRPQHRGYAGEDTGVILGDHNVLREHVTIHRGMPAAKVNTVVGSHNYFMANSHIAHDCTVGSHCNFANGAAVGGHATIGDGVFLSGNSAVHQHCRIGRLALVSGISAATQDIPPFWIIREYNGVAGVNVVGMKRAGIAPAEIAAVRAVFRILYHERMPIRAATERMERLYSHLPSVMEVVAFIRTSKRGVPGAHQYCKDSVAAAA